jgi:RNA 3'-terminal phosphate cyclase (ATP)
MIVIDGSTGEGGGQIVRTALALSLLTGKPFRIENIRAGRKKPGLLRQHLTAVNAAAEIGGAQVSGNTIGSRALTFKPAGLRSGRFRWAIGTAGSCTLVLQAILPALMSADGPSEIVIEGGTHNPFAPPFDFLSRAFLPLVERMGPKVSAELVRPGFFPAGGGCLRVTIDPAASLKPLELRTRGNIRSQRACAAVANLSAEIARRELKVVAGKLGLEPRELEVLEIRDAQGPGNVLTIDIQSQALTEVFTGFGQRGVPAKIVAARAAGQARDYMEAAVPVGRFLADQLLVPMAIAGGGAFVTLPPSRHTLTNIDTIRHFMALTIDAVEKAPGQWEIVLGT